jgi:hypothetical protein
MRVQAPIARPFRERKAGPVPRSVPPEPSRLLDALARGDRDGDGFISVNELTGYVPDLVEDITEKTWRRRLARKVAFDQCFFSTRWQRTSARPRTACVRGHLQRERQNACRRRPARRKRGTRRPKCREFGRLKAALIGYGVGVPLLMLIMPRVQRFAMRHAAI